MDKTVIKGEGIKLLLLLIAIAAILKIVFYKENIATTARTALALWWMFMLPGYALLYYWREKLGFIERTIVGTVAAAAVTAVASYYIGLIGVHVKYHGIILPLAMIIAGIAANWKKGIK